MALDGKEGTLVLVGFFGRGNAGDEAMLQCIYEAFSSRYNIIVAVDRDGSKTGFWNWYPYNEGRIVSQRDIGHLDGMDDCVGLLVGGGGMAPGYAANWALAARGKGIRTALAGVDIGDPGHADAPLFDAMQRWLGLWDYVMPRTGVSFERAERLGANAFYHGDWALNLLRDHDPDVTEDPRRAVVVIREDDIERLQPAYRREFESVLSGLVERGWKPVLLPFSAEDDKFRIDMGLADRFAAEVHWSNARRLKQIISGSGMLVSYGRLHPMIFGATTDVPSATIVPTGIPMMKLREIGDDLGINVHEGSEPFLASLEAGEVRPASSERVRNARRRVAQGLDILHGLFRRR